VVVVEVTERTVVDGDGRVVGEVVGDGVGPFRGGARWGAVEAIVVDDAGGAVAVRFGGGVVVVTAAESEPAFETARTVVVVLVVDEAGTDVVTTRAGCDDRSWLARFKARDPPGGPPASSAPTHRAARPSNPAQAHQASRARSCPRDRSIAKSSANWRRT